MNSNSVDTFSVVINQKSGRGNKTKDKRPFFSNFFPPNFIVRPTKKFTKFGPIRGVPKYGVGGEIKKSVPYRRWRREVRTICTGHFFEICMFRLIFWDHKFVPKKFKSVRANSRARA